MSEPRPRPRFQIVRGGRVLDAPTCRAAPTDLLIEDDVIRAIGPPGLAAPAEALAVDAADRLLISGLVNAHTHGHSNFHRGIGDRWMLEHLLAAGPLVRGDLGAEERYLSTLLGAVEMVTKGCTAAYDLFTEFPGPTAEGLAAVARAYREVGMRATIAPMTTSMSFFRAVPGLWEAIPEALRERFASLTDKGPPGQDYIAVVEAALTGWNAPADQARLAVAPTIPLHCEDAYLKRLADFARASGLGFHTHLAESKVQALVGLRRYGRSLTAHLDAMGALGPHATLAHCVWIDDDDAKRLADAGAFVAHNPGSNMRLGTGVAAVRRMLERGVRVAVGSDGRTSSDNQNMFEAMRLAAFSSRIQGPDSTRWLDAAETFRMGTEAGAAALGFPAIGRLAPGHKADIVFLDLSSPNYLPLNDAVTQIVFAEDATAVRAVMIGGRMVAKDGRCLTVDQGALRDRIRAIGERLRADTAEGRRLAAALEPVVGSFCGALAAHPHHVHRYTGGDIG